MSAQQHLRLLMEAPAQGKGGILLAMVQAQGQPPRHPALGLLLPVQHGPLQAQLPFCKMQPRQVGVSYAHSTGVGICYVFNTSEIVLFSLH